MSKTTFPQLDLNSALSVGQVPAMPQSAVRLLELSRKLDVGPRDFAVPIESDPGLTAQVLRFVNSSYFGFRNEIASVKQAITLVGIRTIKNFTLWSAVFSLIPNPKCGPFDLKSLWQDSLRRALFARHVALLLGLKDPEASFAAALLQDMAIPLLAKEAPDTYRALFEVRDLSADGVRLSSLERDAFGWTHAEAAGVLARSWGLPDDFAVLIEGHLAIEGPARQHRENPGQVGVALSALLPTISDPRWPECGLFEQVYADLCTQTWPSLPALFLQIDREFAEFAPLLKLPLPKRSLVESYEGFTLCVGCDPASAEGDPAHP